MTGPNVLQFGHGISESDGRIFSSSQRSIFSPVHLSTHSSTTTSPITMASYNDEFDLSDASASTRTPFIIVAKSVTSVDKPVKHTGNVHREEAAGMLDI